MSIVNIVLQAGAVVTAEPEVRQVTLPVGGGRIVLASDGLWDATNPKTALHHVRAMPASKAATELVRSSSLSSPRLMPPQTGLMTCFILSSNENYCEFGAPFCCPGTPCLLVRTDAVSEGLSTGGC